MDSASTSSFYSESFPVSLFALDEEEKQIYGKQVFEEEEILSLKPLSFHYSSRLATVASKKPIFSLPALFRNPFYTNNNRFPREEKAQQKEKEEEVYERRERKKKSNKKHAPKVKTSSHGSGQRRLSDNDYANDPRFQSSHSTSSSNAGSNNHNHNSNNGSSGSDCNNRDNAGNNSCFVSSPSKAHGDDDEIISVFVKNLPEDFTREMLEALLRPFGGFNAKISMDESHKCKGFGFVSMSPKQLEAIHAQGDVVAGDNVLWLGQAMRKEERSKMLSDRFAELQRQRQQEAYGKNLFVRNLPLECEESHLMEMFGPLGQWTSIKIMRDERGMSKGCGFCAYRTAEEAQHAMNMTNGKVLMNRELVVTLHTYKSNR